jgi:drug/metabolite transporter (DMT)-like permease
MRDLFILILVNAMWAFQFAGAKIATEQLGPITVALTPVAISTLLLFPLLWVPSMRGQSERAPIGTLRAVGEFILLALLGPIPAQLGLVWGIEKSLASNAAVLNLTIPVATALMAWFLVGEKMTRLRWISFALAIVGAIVVSADDIGSARLWEGKYGFGNFLILVSCMGSAFNNTYSKRLLNYFTPLEVLVFGFGASSVILAAAAVTMERASLWKLPSLGMAAWLNLGAIAVFSLSLSMLLFLRVIDRIDVTQASLTIYLLPVFGILFSSLTLHEPLRPQLLAGGALVFVSTFLVTIYEEMGNRKVSVTAQ